MDNKNMNELMKMISNMDKSELEKGLNQVSQLLNSPKADELITEIKKNQK